MPALSEVWSLSMLNLDYTEVNIVAPDFPDR
jgi:hypothetical protein